MLKETFENCIINETCDLDGMCQVQEVLDTICL